MNKKTYYCIAGHVFSVNMVLDPAYEPFKVTGENSTAAFEFNIKMESFKGSICHPITQQKDGETEISAGTYKEKMYFEFGLSGKRSAVLITDSCFREGTLFVQEHPKYSIDSGLMVMYAMATATRSTLLFHSSVVIKDEEYAYMFLGKSGTGKSTHSRLWIDTIKGVKLLNDDNPVVRVFQDGRVFVYGSPWSGKTPCYRNDYARLGGIAMLYQDEVISVRELVKDDAFKCILISVSGIKWDDQVRVGQQNTIGDILKSYSIYEAGCRPDSDSVKLCHDTICFSRQASK